MLAKSVDDRYKTPTEVFEAIAPFVPAEAEPPPEDEMPVLSPAARASTAQAMAGSVSGSFRQDSAVLRAEHFQRSGRMASIGQLRPPSAIRPAPAMATAPTFPGESGSLPPGSASSGNMRPAYYEPPPIVSPLGSAAIPPVPNPVRPVNETLRLSEATDRARIPTPPIHWGTVNEASAKRGLHPVFKIFLESVLVFGLCLGLYFIIRWLWL